MNEFDPSTSYFDLITVEEKIRRASTFKDTNCYYLVHYACCREIFNKDKHKLIKDRRLAKVAKELIESAEEQIEARGGENKIEEPQPIENFA